MAASAYASVVQQLYISYFGRPADASGLVSFEAQLAATSAPTDFAALNVTLQAGTNASLNALVNGFSTSAESMSLYGSGIGLGAISIFVNAIYNNVLNRDADEDGLVFWTQAITSGALSKVDASVAIMAGALANTSDQGRLDAAVVSNKLTVASSFTQDLTTTAQIGAYAGDAAAAAARAMLGAVTDSTDPTAFEATVVSTIGAIAATAGVTTTLTSAGDILGGGAGNDTYLAPAAGPYTDTLNSADVIDGGAGVNTLRATIAAMNETPTLNNIQTVTLSFAGGSLNLLHATGLTSVVVENGESGTITNLGAVGALTVKQQSVDMVFAGSTVKTLALTLDQVDPLPYGGYVYGNTITLADDFATTINLSIDNSRVTIETSTATSTLSVVAIGSSQLSMVAPVLASVTVAGTGSISFGDELSAVTSLDASGNSGGVQVILGSKASTITGGSGSDFFSFDAIASGARVNMGAGSDSVLIDGVVADTTAVIDGGTGTNYLILTVNADLSYFRTPAQFEAAFLNFQYLEVDGFGTKPTTVDLSVVAGFSVYFVEIGAVVLDNMAAGTTVYAQDIVALTLDTDATGASAIAASAVALTLDNQSDTADYGVTVGRLSTDAATLTLHSHGVVGSYSTNTVTLDSAEANLSTVIIDGSQTLHVTTGALTGHTLNIDASAATGAVTVDASAALEQVDINGGGAADTLKSGAVGGVIDGAAGGDAIILGAGSTDTIVYKAASDSVLSVDPTGATPGTGIDTITGFVAGIDKIDLSALRLDGTGIVAKTAADLNALSTLAATAGFYNDADGIARSVVEVIVGADSYLFVDANKDHKFDASTDLVIKLAGVASIVASDLVFV